MSGSYGTFRVRDHSEILVLCEVFVDEIYADPDLPAAADLILDLGCNVGAASVWFARRYPAASVIGVEADPKTAALARENTSDYGNVRIIDAAVSDHSGTVKLWINPSSWESTITGGSGEGVQVRAVSLDELLAQGGPRRLVKIDVEGAEHAIFRASTKLDSVEFITGEYHTAPGESWSELIDHLGGFVVSPDGNAPDQQRTFTARRR